MKGSISFSLSACIASIISFAVAGGATSAPITKNSIAKPDTRSDVIVILRDQLASAPPIRGAMGIRAAAVASSQSAVVTRLQQSAPRKITTFSTINAFATKVSEAEREQLALDPSVQAVVPDLLISAPKHVRAIDLAAAASAVSGGSVKAASTAAATAGLCNTLEPEALQLTNTAFLDQSTPQAQNVHDGNGIPVTGKGVKVAWMADGLDPNVPGFIRPDGSHVFIDYQDFSGDPAGTATAGEEAFGDAASIAAQDHPNGKLLQYDISQFVNAAHPLPSPCNIQIRGMAPGASLVGLKVFSQLGYTTTSGFVQAIEYAIVHDGVDIINQSFGGNPYPDTSSDPISLADAAAVAAGVTIVVSSGDAGSSGTLGSPTTLPAVISAGASTQYRLYAQTVQGAQDLVKTSGWVSNQISPLSSGGFAQNTPRTVDVVAPGDLGWSLCSSNVALFNDCTSFAGLGTPITDFGGTSESSPLTAGLAALVIQAYRSTHHGASPTPAVVKEIIMSTATDLDAPAFEQGAGLINSLQAVHAALAYVDKSATPTPRGDVVVATPSTAGITALPNTHQTQSFTLTNTGTSTRHFSPALQALGAPVAGANLSLNLNPAVDPTLINPTGAPRPYIKQTFNVPAGVDHLDASYAFKIPVGSGATPIVYMSLFDPSGRQVVYSIPQGFGSGYGHVDALKPVAGTWTAVIFTRPPGVAGSYSGAVQFSWAAQNFVSVGTVSPSTVALAPGASTTITADFFTPSEPGDSTVAVKFGAGTDRPDIPLVLRTLIPMGASGGSFTGTLTGGNGRAGVGPYQTYEFDVPTGVSNMSLNLTLPDNGYVLEGVLVDPNGMQLSVQPNIDPFGAQQYALQLTHQHPQAGRWKFTLVTDFTASGNQTSLTYSARIGFNTADVTTRGLPGSASTKLSASGKPVTFKVNITNTGPITTQYFVDSRLSTPAVTQLPTYTCASVATLPGTVQCYYVPTQVSSIEFLGQSKVPLQMDVYNFVGYNVAGTGNPDIFAQPVATDTVAATLTEPEVPYSLWVAVPSLIGPYGASGAPTEPVVTTAYATMKPFDTAMSADSGDIWADLLFGTNTFNPLVLAPGESGTITVTVTPDPSLVGKTVSGFIYIDTFNGVVSTGDETVAKPYIYTVAE